MKIELETQELMALLAHHLDYEKLLLKDEADERRDRQRQKKDILKSILEAPFLPLIIARALESSQGGAGGAPPPSSPSNSEVETLLVALLKSIRKEQLMELSKTLDPNQMLVLMEMWDLTNAGKPPLG